MTIKLKHSRYGEIMRICLRLVIVIDMTSKQVLGRVRASSGTIDWSIGLLNIIIIYIIVIMLSAQAHRHRAHARSEVLFLNVYYKQYCLL